MSGERCFLSLSQPARPLSTPKRGLGRDDRVPPESGMVTAYRSTLLFISLLEYAESAFNHQAYNKEPERRLGETCLTRTACELGDAHSDCVHWQCQCKRGFRIEFLHGLPVCVTGFFPTQCYSHSQCKEMDEHSQCVSNVCDCDAGYLRELIYWKYVCRPEKSDKSLIIFILSFTLLLLIFVLLYIGKHYVQSECASPRSPQCPASSAITGFSGSIQDSDSPEWDLVVIPRAVRPPSPVLPSKEDLPPSYEEVMRYLSRQSSKR